MDCSRAIKIGKIAGAGGRFERCLAMVMQDYHAMDLRNPDAVYQGSKRMGLKINCGRSAAGWLIMPERILPTAHRANQIRRTFSSAFTDIEHVSAAPSHGTRFNARDRSIASGWRR